MLLLKQALVEEAAARLATGERERAPWLQKSILPHVHMPSLPDAQSELILCAHSWHHRPTAWI